MNEYRQNPFFGSLLPAISLSGRRLPKARFVGGGLGDTEPVICLLYGCRLHYTDLFIYLILHMHTFTPKISLFAALFFFFSKRHV